VSVAQEHLASSIVRAALTLLSGQRPEIRGTAVLACAPGEGHEVALLMLAVLLRLDGRQVAYLEADTPYADTVRLADDLDAHALCFSAALRASAAVLDDEPAAAPQRESLLLCVGGRATETSDLRQAVNRLHVHTA